jgi:hypothetical protein
MICAAHDRRDGEWLRPHAESPTRAVLVEIKASMPDRTSAAPRKFGKAAGGRDFDWMAALLRSIRR